MASEAEILDELRRLRARVPQLTGALATGVDGLVLAQDTPGVEPERVAALTVTALGVAVRMADATGQGDFRELIVRGVYGYVATYAAGRGAVLTVLAQDRVHVGRLLLEGRRAGPGSASWSTPGRRPRQRRQRPKPPWPRSGPTRRRPSRRPRKPPPHAREQRAHHAPPQAPTRVPPRKVERNQRSTVMANTETSLKEALTSIEGATGVALVDYTSGMALGTMGGSKTFDLGVAAAGNTDVVRSKLRTMEHLGLKGEIEDILITLSSQYHLIRLLKGRGGNGLFLYLVLDAGRANLAMARHQLKKIEADLEV